MKQNYWKNISLGKIAYANPARKVNEVILQVSLGINNPKGLEFKVNCKIINATGTDIVDCGNNFYTGVKRVFSDNAKAVRLCELWEAWAFNYHRAQPDGSIVFEQIPQSVIDEIINLSDSLSA